MSIETEIKVPIEAARDFIRRLDPLRPIPLSERHFEDNFLLDYPDGRICSQREVLRVRTAGRVALLTYKGPPLPSALFKVREELEIQVEDGTTVLRILDRLGLRIWFRYQKYRQEYAILSGRDPGERLHVAIDETPIGNYAEIEGTEPGIREAARTMGFSDNQFLRHSYYTLYIQFCRERGQTAGHMVFPDESGQNDQKKG